MDDCHATVTAARETIWDTMVQLFVNVLFQILSSCEVLVMVDDCHATVTAADAVLGKCPIRITNNNDKIKIDSYNKMPYIKS